MAHLKELKPLNPASNLNTNALKLKLRVYTLCPFPLYNYNRNVLHKQVKNKTKLVSLSKYIWTELFWKNRKKKITPGHVAV